VCLSKLVYFVTGNKEDTSLLQNLSICRKLRVTNDLYYRPLDQPMLTGLSLGRVLSSLSFPRMEVEPQIFMFFVFYLSLHHSVFNFRSGRFSMKFTGQLLIKNLAQSHL